MCVGYKSPRYSALFSAQDPDSIVMTIDMHLTLPTGFIEAIRRVCSNCVTGTVQVSIVNTLVSYTYYMYVSVYVCACTPFFM